LRRGHNNCDILSECIAAREETGVRASSGSYFSPGAD
jgi:hypothetical protein